MEEKNIWHKNFDRIFCISLADNIKRRELLEKELARVGILDSGIFEWKITIDNPYYRYIWTHPGLNCGNVISASKKSNLNCTFAHYEVMKQSIAIGYKNVLIIEDDIRFLKDLNEIETILNNIPEYDILIFDKALHKNKEIFAYSVNNKKVNDYYFDYSSVKLWSTGCYAMSLKAMEKVAEYQEYLFLPADMATNRVNGEGEVVFDDDLKRVASIKNLARQDFSDMEQFDPQRLFYEWAYENVCSSSDYNLETI